jgi:hypothetical protein
MTTFLGLFDVPERLGNLGERVRSVDDRRDLSLR